MSFSIKKVGVLASVLVSAAIYSSASSAITVDFTGGGGNLGMTVSFNTGFVGVTGSDALSQDADGLGVIGIGDSDEINGLEFITVTFDQAVNINSITVDDLWVDRGDDSAGYRINGLPTASFIMAVNNFGTGLPTVATFGSPLIGVTSLSFFAPLFNNTDRGYALRAIDYDIVSPPSEVPVPAAFWLLGSAMVFLFRKRNNS